MPFYEHKDVQVVSRCEHRMPAASCRLTFSLLYFSNEISSVSFAVSSSSMCVRMMKFEPGTGRATQFNFITNMKCLKNLFHFNLSISLALSLSSSLLLSRTFKSIHLLLIAAYMTIYDFDDRIIFRQKQAQISPFSLYRSPSLSFIHSVDQYGPLTS